MEFYTNFKKPKRMQETFNNKYQTIYKAEIDTKTGERKLVEKEKINVYDKIQEFKDECNIASMMERYQLNMHDTISQNEEKLIDLTNLPENLMETMKAIDDAKYLWERQSKEVKQKFDNDFNKFIAGSENGQIVEMVNQQLKKEYKQPEFESYNNLKTKMDNLTKAYNDYISNSKNEEDKTIGNFIKNNIENVKGSENNV